MTTIPWENEPVPDYPPVFILVGVGRSGTTYLGHELKDGLDMSHPTEPKLIVPLFHQLDRFGDLGRPENLRRLCQHVFDSRLYAKLRIKHAASITVEEMIERVEENNYRGVIYAALKLMAEKQKRSRLGYKDPFDVENLALLSRILPTAKFIHVVRDGRDVAISTCRMEWGATNLYAAAREWAAGIDLAHDDAKALGSRYFELNLENLVHDTENVAAQLADFVNEGTDPEETAAFVRRINESKNPSVLNPWKKKLSKRQLELCEAAAGDQLVRCGYDLVFDGQARVSPLTGLAYRSLDTPVRGAKAIARRMMSAFKKAS